jgi:subtilisin family serine protease
MESQLTRSPWMTVEGAKAALAEGRGAGIRIAVIDSGIEVSHPSLKGIQLGDDIHIVDNGIQIEVRDGDGTDIYGHGTAVASIIREVAPEVELASFRVLGPRRNSRTVIIREGVRQAIDRGYNILNCSFGCAVQEHIFQYKDWIDESYLKGIHLVAACSNLDFRSQEWPGSFPSVVTVNMAVTDRKDRLYYKPGYLVEFAARGVNVTAAWRDGQTREVTGSSFAAPLVAALLARLLSVAPRLDPMQAKALLRQVAEDWSTDIQASNESIGTNTTNAPR